tara:strand:- start:390 stop:689 length:300 start_codon:yes stop_codon:yes gene_type:complete
MKIQNISSAPEYITVFIKNNMEQLCKIYEEGLVNNSEGILACICSEKENRIDVQFNNEEEITKMITKETWIPFKDKIPKDKKLLMIQDLDLNCIFIIYV